MHPAPVVQPPPPTRVNPVAPPRVQVVQPLPPTKVKPVVPPRVYTPKENSTPAHQHTAPIANIYITGTASPHLPPT